MKKQITISLEEESIDFIEEHRKKIKISSFSSALDSLILTLKELYEADKIKRGRK